MFDLREIDAKNTYEPNLDDKKESYERTYGEVFLFLYLFYQVFFQFLLSLIPNHISSLSNY